MADATDLAKPWTLRQLDFLSRFLSSGNAAKSYRAVYRCSQASAVASSSRLLADPRARLTIEAALQDALKKVGVSADRVATLLRDELQAEAATANPTDRVTLLRLANYLLAPKPPAHQPVSADPPPDSASST